MAMRKQIYQWTLNGKGAYNSDDYPNIGEEISNVISQNIGMTPYDIENRLKLRNPMYLDTASYGHMGRKPSVIKKDFTSLDGNNISFDVETFTWEKLDMIDKIKELIK